MLGGKHSIKNARVKGPESVHVNLSSTPRTNLESYILCLHCTSRRRDLKEK